ncbi:MAG TPA: fatty acid desaturase [Steroidobacteraceae bacterium]|jgi:fatty acid desaturase|nr:fatty acid desaturase [Steroidobacteraceae bacterium]
MSTIDVPTPGVLSASRDYRSRVLAALDDGGWSADVEAAAQAAVHRLTRARRRHLVPHAGRAALAFAQTLVFVVAPLYVAGRILDVASAWMALPFLIVAGMGLYGGLAIVHDLAHSSLLRSRPMNTILGYVLAPLLLMEFGGFRRSHLGHHRFIQSACDPKRFGVEHKEETRHPEHSSLDLCPAPVRAPLRLAAACVTLPLRVRQFLYLFVVPVIMGPAVLLFSGEFSVARRDWRRAESWWATAASVLLLALLYAWSPQSLALFLVALLIGHSFSFHVFAAHMSPNQVYWTSPRRSVMADALNVSDVHCGALSRLLGHGLSDYHSLHHLLPSIACYHLPAAEALIASDLAMLRAPAIDLLDPAACALLFDGIFSGVVYKNREAWDYAHEGGMRRVATPEAYATRG